jgi:iron complex transport system substrate-binding protein
VSARTAGAAALAIVVLACGGSHQPTGQGRRLVSLHDTTTEIVVGLGRAGELVAITEPEFLSPQAQGAVARVPRLPAGRLSAEELLLHDPDWVLGTDVVSELQPDLERALVRLGVSHHWIDPVGIDGLFDSIEELGGELGAGAVAESWTDDLRRRLPGGESEGDPLRVFVYDCCDPPFTAGGRIPANEILRRLGARNVFEDIAQDWTRVSWESVVLRDPELIVIDDYDADGQLDGPAKMDFLRGNPFLSEVTAVRNERFLELSLGLLLEGPRNFELIEPLREALGEARARRSVR